LDRFNGLPGQSLRSDAVASDDPDHVSMDGKRCRAVVSNFQIELKVDEIVEFEVGIVLLVTRLTHNGNFYSIPN
jgi:hypothetical protein